MAVNYYRILEVNTYASAATIKKRYRELCKTYHPDAGGNDGQMAAINRAYAVLSDPVKRAKHDRELAIEREKQKLAKAVPNKPEPVVPMGEEAFEVITPKRFNFRMWPWLLAGGAAVALIYGILYVMPVPIAATTITPNTQQVSVTPEPVSVVTTTAATSSTDNTQSPDTTTSTQPDSAPVTDTPPATTPPDSGEHTSRKHHKPPFHWQLP